MRATKKRGRRRRIARDTKLPLMPTQKRRERRERERERERRIGVHLIRKGKRKNGTTLAPYRKMMDQCIIVSRRMKL